MEIAVPEGCTLTDVSIRAQSDEAFTAAAKELSLVTTSDITGTREHGGRVYAYRYRFATGLKDGVSIHVRGPRREQEVSIV